MANKGLNNLLSLSTTLLPCLLPPHCPNLSAVPTTCQGSGLRDWALALTSVQYTDAPDNLTSYSSTFFRILVKVHLPGWSPSPTFLINSNFLALLSFFCGADHHPACYIMHLFNCFFSVLECKFHEGRDLAYFTPEFLPKAVPCPE